jgi:hypothetical protein
VAVEHFVFDADASPCFVRFRAASGLGTNAQFVEAVETGLLSEVLRAVKLRGRCSSMVSFSAMCFSSSPITVFRFLSCLVGLWEGSSRLPPIAPESQASGEITRCEAGIWEVEWACCRWNYGRSGTYPSRILPKNVLELGFATA